MLQKHSDEKNGEKELLNLRAAKLVDAWNKISDGPIHSA
jgi:hypothetical protein